MNIDGEYYSRADYNQFVCGFYIIFLLSVWLFVLSVIIENASMFSLSIALFIFIVFVTKYKHKGGVQK